MISREETTLGIMTRGQKMAGNMIKNLFLYCFEPICQTVRPTPPCPTRARPLLLHYHRHSPVRFGVSLQRAAKVMYISPDITRPMSDEQHTFHPP